MLACLVLAGFVGTVQAQQTGKIVVVGVSDRFSGMNGGESTYGITNVGVGARVVLKPYVLSGTGLKYNDSLVAVTSATWSVTGPKGAVTIQDTTTGSSTGLIVYFKPDTTGVFVVIMDATTARGVANANMQIKSARFRGVGTYNASLQNYSGFKCGPCHSQTDAVFASFSKTKHASVFPRRVDEVAGHFGATCLKCHTVGYNTFAVNNGFDETKTAAGFNVPPNHPGVYDSLVAATALNPNLSTMLDQTGIQCENCHGPAGEHAQFGDPSKMAVSFQSDVCAPCHYSSDRHPKGYSWEGSAHAVSTKEGDLTVEYLNRPSCARCHTGNGYVDQTINGNPEPVVPSGQKLYAATVPITCQACHDPHSAKNPYQLRTATVGDACMGCHITRISSRGLHHSGQGTMLLGAETIPMTQSSLSGPVGMWSGWEFPGYTYVNSSHSDIQARCAECHMAASPDFDPTFVSPDTLLNKVGGHTFKVVYDAGTPADESDDILNNSGCKECHGAVTLEYVKLSQDNVKAAMATLYALLPKRDTSITTYPNGTPSVPGDSVTWQLNRPSGAVRVKMTTTQKAAAYNYYFVEYDGSFGVHNHDYAMQLLNSSIEQMQLGAGSASLTSIKDVPNDQGRRVQLVWNMFPAENFSYSPVINYGIWREDQIVGTKVAPKKSYTTMIQEGLPGMSYSVMGKVWTYVANVPATKLSQYGFVSETMIDSTSGGTKYAKFYVAGYAANNAAVYSSPVDSGYSVDNIAPFRVTAFSATATPSGAVLIWTPVDQDDVAKFLVYRGATIDFTPGAPLAEVAALTYTDPSITTGQVAYYMIQGVDKSGNLGELSSPTQATGVEMTDGAVPTEYALGQNYPNPFNPTTIIPFSLPNAGRVVLNVYTISGELVATVLDNDLAAGRWTATWDGKDKSGRHVATGMYLYRIQAEKFSSVKKMVLLK
jgi:predicted CXXCH cytochrome family protein